MISRLRQRGSRGRQAAWPDLALSVEGPAGLVEHLVAEYGIRTLPGADAAGLVIGAFGSQGPAASPTGDGGRPSIRSTAHKTTRWRTRLGPAGAEPIRLEVEIRGLFGPSLVQSMVIEPLISIALARRGSTLISAAGIIVDGRALAIAGISRSGKSSLALRAWGRGLEMLGDDRLTVTPDGLVNGFPRRLRIYPDLAKTAPIAYRRLGSAVRRRLRVLDLVRRLSLGWVALPALVDADVLGTRRAAVTLGRIVVLDRADPRTGTDASRNETDGTSIVELADEATVWRRLEVIVAKDLAWPATNGPDWVAAAADVRTTQLDILRRAVAASGARLSVVTVPADWTAARAIEGVARHLGLEP